MASIYNALYLNSTMYAYPFHPYRQFFPLFVSQIHPFRYSYRKPPCRQFTVNAPVILFRFCDDSHLVRILFLQLPHLGYKFPFIAAEKCSVLVRVVETGFHVRIPFRRQNGTSMLSTGIGCFSHPYRLSSVRIPVTRFVLAE